MTGGTDCLRVTTNVACATGGAFSRDTRPLPAQQPPSRPVVPRASSDAIGLVASPLNASLIIVWFQYR